MPRIAGVTTQKNTRGEITHITINVKKHKDVITPVMEQLGVIGEDQFEKDWKTGRTPDEWHAGMVSILKTLPWGK